MALVALAMILGCENQPPVDVAVMPKLVGIDYFNACEAGAKEAAEELGLQLVYDGPTTNSVEEQAKIIETWIARRIPIIAVAPNDPDQIAPVLRKARERGLTVLTYDADAARDARAFFVNQTPNEAIARTLVDVMVEAIGPAGKYIILTGSLTAANQRIWIGLMETYREETYPQMVNLSPEPKPSEEDQALATRVTIDILKSYPDVQGIFAMTSVALPGAAEALRKQNAADRVFLTGMATPKTMQSYVKDGTVKKFVLWNPVDLGYLTVHAGKMLREGKLAPGTINAGRLEGIAVRDDEVILGDPIVFDASNIDDFDF